MFDFCSVVYGLRVRSNRAIPRARSIALTPTVDLNVRLSDGPSRHVVLSEINAPWYSSCQLDAEGKPVLEVWKICEADEFELRYSDGTKFSVDGLGTSVRATWLDVATIDDMATYLLGPVMGFVLLLRGIHSLHASAVAVGGQAIALVGPAGAGKSTTAAAFATLGYRVLSDDVAALAPRGGDFYVQPAYPCIRLWPEAVEALFGVPDALPLLTPNWDKRYLDLDNGSHQFQLDPLPLAAVYVFGERSADSAAPRVEAMSPNDALIALTGNAYVPYLKDKAARAQEFELLRQIVASIPVRRVIPHADPRHIYALCEIILNDFGGLNTSHASTAATVEIEHI